MHIHKQTHTHNYIFFSGGERDEFRATLIVRLVSGLV